MTIHLHTAMSQSRSDDSVDKSSNPGSRPKRKRGRVSVTQLAYLEHAYGMDRSLDAQRRKEISDALAMDERQITVWFQNRRTKAKLLEQRERDATRSAAANLVEIPPLDEMKAILQECDDISLVPCTKLSIGNWHRANSSHIDVLVFISGSQRTLTYYTRSAGVGLKMRLPFHHITSVDYTRDAAPGCDHAALILNQPPTFYREAPSPAAQSSSQASATVWRPTTDWTTGGQGPISAHHEIFGYSQSLGAALGSLLAVTPASIMQQPESRTGSAIPASPSGFIHSPMPLYASRNSFLSENNVPIAKHAGFFNQSLQARPCSPTSHPRISPDVSDTSSSKQTSPLSVDSLQSFGAGHAYEATKESLIPNSHPSSAGYYADYGTLPDLQKLHTAFASRPPFGSDHTANGIQQSRRTRPSSSEIRTFSLAMPSHPEDIASTPISGADSSSWAHLLDSYAQEQFMPHILGALPLSSPNIYKLAEQAEQLAENSTLQHRQRVTAARMALPRLNVHNGQTPTEYTSGVEKKVSICYDEQNRTNH